MYKSMSLDEFYQKAKRDSLAVIDVREVEEFNRGHIPNAINKPLSKLATEFNTLDKEQEYFIICQSGIRSAQASEFLSNNGYHVINLLGGMSAWHGAIE